MTILHFAVKSVDKNVLHTDDSVYRHSRKVRAGRRVNALDKRIALGSVSVTVPHGFLELLSLKLHLKLIVLRKRFGKFFHRFFEMTNEQKKFLQIETARMELNLMSRSGLYCRLRTRVKCSNVLTRRSGV